LAQEAFYGLAGDVVRAIEPHTEADPAALLINFLAYFGNAVDRTPHALAEADRHGTNIFAVLVGESAKGRKGSSTGHIHELFHRVDPSWTENRIMGGLSSGEGLIWAVRDSINRTEPVKEKGRHTGEYQTIEVDPGVSDKRLLCYEPEFAGVLRVISRETNTLSALIRQAWDRGNLRTLTKNTPAVATNALFLHLGISLKTNYCVTSAILRLPMVLPIGSCGCVPAALRYCLKVVGCQTTTGWSSLSMMP
jgi:hypothetical protein